MAGEDRRLKHQSSYDEAAFHNNNHALSTVSKLRKLSEPEGEVQDNDSGAEAASTNCTTSNSQHSRRIGQYYEQDPNHQEEKSKKLKDEEFFKNICRNIYIKCYNTDYYAALNLSREATEQDIHIAFHICHKTTMKLWHEFIKYQYYADVPSYCRYKYPYYGDAHIYDLLLLEQKQALYVLGDKERRAKYDDTSRFWCQKHQIVSDDVQESSILQNTTQEGRAYFSYQDRIEENMSIFIVNRFKYYKSWNQDYYSYLGLSQDEIHASMHKRSLYYTAIINHFSQMVSRWDISELKGKNEQYALFALTNLSYEAQACFKVLQNNETKYWYDRSIKNPHHNRHQYQNDVGIAQYEKTTFKANSLCTPAVKEAWLSCQSENSRNSCKAELIWAKRMLLQAMEIFLDYDLQEYSHFLKRSEDYLDKLKDRSKEYPIFWQLIDDKSHKFSSMRQIFKGKEHMKPMIEEAIRPFYSAIQGFDLKRYQRLAEQDKIMCIKEDLVVELKKLRLPDYIGKKNEIQFNHMKNIAKSKPIVWGSIAMSALVGIGYLLNYVGYEKICESARALSHRLGA